MPVCPARRCVYFITLALATFMTHPSLAAGPYHVTRTVALHDSDSWDYLTTGEAQRRIYITRSTHIDVYSADTFDKIGTIAGIQGAHGVALAPQLDRGFATNGKTGLVTIFALSSLKSLEQVKTEAKPDAIVFEPKTSRVFAFNGDAGSATVIDAASGKVLATLPLGGQPEFAAVDGRGSVYVNLEDKNALLTIDAQSLKVKGTYPLAPCESPTGLAIDQANHRLFSVCRNKVMVVSNPDTGKIIANLPIGAGADAAVFDPATKKAFSANGADATLTVVSETSPENFAVTQTVATTSGARTLALDAAKHRLILIGGKFGPKAVAGDGVHARAPLVPGSVQLVVVSRE